MVGDGDAMSVAGQIAENLVGTAEGRLGIDDPVPTQTPENPVRRVAHQEHHCCNTCRTDAAICRIADILQ
jgi:hypothetical protein